MGVILQDVSRFFLFILNAHSEFITLCQKFLVFSAGGIFSNACYVSDLS
jgi:hypothetical protein